MAYTKGGIYKLLMSDRTSVSEEEEAEQPKGSKPHDPDEINPKLSSDIHYWAQEFNVTGQQLHEAIRVHGTHVKKVREALHPKK